jgi:hypothetical protein
MSEVGTVNDQLVLITGYSATGKSAALRNIRNQERWLYMGTEAGKRLPFKNKFLSQRISNAYEVHQYMDEIIANPDKIDGAVIDSLTFLMDMFESQYVLNSTNTMKAWSDYQQFFKILMQEKVTIFGKPMIITAHNKDELDEKAMEMKVSVPIKGALKNNGIEAYFSTVVAAKKVALRELEAYLVPGNPMLTVNSEEELLGYKHVFQTRPTKQTTGERMRSPMGMFTPEQTFIDNDAQLLLDHLTDFYGH